MAVGLCALLFFFCCCCCLFFGVFLAWMAQASDHDLGGKKGPVRSMPVTFF